MGHEGPEEQRYSSTLCLTLALDGGGWSLQGPVCSKPGKENQYPLYRWLGGPQGQSAQVWKISPPPAFNPRLCSPQQVTVLTMLSQSKKPRCCKSKYSTDFSGQEIICSCTSWNEPYQQLFQTEIVYLNKVFVMLYTMF